IKGGLNLRIISRIQPLLFCFSDTDHFLDGRNLLRDQKIPCALSLFCGKYYLTLYCPLRARRALRASLGEFGGFAGIGVVLDAYIAEHGTRICENLWEEPAQTKSVCCKRF
ncbi:MAG: hypothetical protein RSC76_05160, partial [Oscillospiraceae bacterium]